VDEILRPSIQGTRPAKLLALTQEIMTLLHERDRRVKETHRELKEQEKGKGNLSGLPPVTSESSG
jgi:hypothetical protein